MTLRMHFGSEEADSVYERWRPGYIERAEVVQGDLAALFQEAFSQEAPGSISKNQGVTTSIEFLRERRKAFPHRLISFIYSSRFDSGVAQNLLESAKDPLPEELNLGEISNAKAGKLAPVLKCLTMCADQLAAHYVIALVSKDHGIDLPLTWEAPVFDEAETGVSRDFGWWMVFQYVCEMSGAIIAYGGCTEAFFNEYQYIRGQPHLKKRLLWLDQDMTLYRPDQMEQQSPILDIATVLDILDS